MQPYLNIFGKNISSYAVLMVVAFLICGFIFYMLTKNKLSPIDTLLFAVYIFIGGIVGAKLLSMIISLKVFIASGNLNIVLWIINSGLVFYGGVIGGFLMGSLYIKLYGLSPKQLWKNVCVVLPLGSAIGRLGCFLNGCCYGKLTSSSIGVVFNNSPLQNIHALKVLPTQLFEMAICLIIFIVLLLINKKEHKDYYIVFLYAALYGVARFIIEFLRGDEARGILVFLSTSQIISILLITFGMLLYYTKFKNTYLFTQTPPIIKPSKQKSISN